MHTIILKIATDLASTNQHASHAEMWDLINSSEDVEGYLGRFPTDWPQQTDDYVAAYLVMMGHKLGPAYPDELNPIRKYIYDESIRLNVATRYPTTNLGSNPSTQVMLDQLIPTVDLE